MVAKTAAYHKLNQYRDELAHLFELSCQLSRHIHKLEQLHVSDIHNLIETGKEDIADRLLEGLVTQTAVRWNNDLKDLVERLKYNNRLQG